MVRHCEVEIGCCLYNSSIYDRDTTRPVANRARSTGRLDSPGKLSPHRGSHGLRPPAVVAQGIVSALTVQVTLQCSTSNVG